MNAPEKPKLVIVLPPSEVAKIVRSIREIRRLRAVQRDTNVASILLPRDEVPDVSDAHELLARISQRSKHS